MPSKAVGNRHLVMRAGKAEMQESGDKQLAVAEDREKAIALFTFLKEFVRLGTQIVRSLNQYEKVLWIDSIPHEPECYCQAWEKAEGEETVGPWIEVRKPRLKPPPDLPEELVVWVNVSEIENSRTEAPELRESIAVEVPQEDPEGGTRTEFIRLEDCPDIKSAWEEYLSGWRIWAEEDRRKRKVNEVYKNLFSLYQDQKELGESFEVILGFGLLRWTVPCGQLVRRHLVTAQTALEFDAAAGVISVGPAGEGAKPQLEQDMLERDECPDAKLQASLEQEVASLGDELWHNPALMGILGAYVHSLGNGEGDFDENLAVSGDTRSIPDVCFAPALILRRRTDRGFVRLYESILQNLQDSPEIPLGIRPLVNLNFAGGGSFQAPQPDPEGRVKSHVAVDSEEHYFPLLSNDEQREIIRRLHNKAGVLVQGPPGTGKSHTIANLICHLLAQGKRVLVTSQTARALRVLKDKLPPQITDLCVILLGNDRTALEDLESSVSGITDKLNTWTPHVHTGLVENLRQRLDSLRRDQASIDAQLRALRESQTYKHPPSIGHYSGTFQQIAQQLREQEPTYGWIAQHLGNASTLPENTGISDAQAVEVFRVFSEIDHERRSELAQAHPQEKELLSPEQFGELVQAEREASDRVRDTRQDESPAPTWMAGIPTERIQLLSKAVNFIDRTCHEMEAHIYDWTNRLVDDVLADQDRSWRELLSQTQQRIEAIRLHPDHIIDLGIKGQGDIEISVLRDDAKTIIDHIDSGGKLKKLLGYPKVVRDRRYIVKQVHVGGKPCNQVETIRSLWAWADVQCHLRALKNIWSDVTEVPNASMQRMLAIYADYCEPLELAMKLHKVVQKTKELAKGLPAQIVPKWHVLAEVQQLGRNLKFVLAKRKLDSVSKNFEDLVVGVRSCYSSNAPHSSVSQLLHAIEQRLPDEYGHTYAEVSRLWRDKIRLDECVQVLSGLTPPLAELFGFIKDHATDGQWDARLSQLSKAWDWLRADRWLKESQDPERATVLDTRRQQIRIEIHTAIGQLAAEKGWIFCMSRLKQDNSLQAYLKAWMEAIKKIGRGTSKRATKFSRVARENLEKCRPAIPCWIMPIYRVVETVDPRPNIFDVVIIDEASQCGIESLFVHFIAKQVIVVGDNNQIAPSYVGRRKEDVEALARRYIQNVPLGQYYDLDNSFFTQAFLRFPDHIRLREHFRCMPEIIQFSNNLSYKNEPLIALRQYGAGRLEPVVDTHYVQDGYTSGHSPNIVNQPEAEAVVERIANYVKDPRYKNKTIGVISLLGDRQAQHIERLLLDRIGPEEIEKRRLRCGNAYDFQGDERHVIFLSMVSARAADKRIYALTKEEDKRRFNVAASRAQDQLILVHSVGLEDLSPQCLRRQLLEYCLHPRLDQEVLPDLKLAELRNMATNSEQRRFPQPAPFGSWFEVDVFLRIVERGYRVRPQYEVADYRIDLVVEGLEGRLAIECDGDEWHGAERYESDMSRQRQLERCGWTFWRTRGGQFYRDPDEALAKLWTLLEEHKIYPDAGTPKDSSGTHTAGTYEDVKTEQQNDGDGSVDAGMRSEEAHSCPEDASEDMKVDSEADEIENEVASDDADGLKQASAMKAGPTFFDRRRFRCPDPRTASLKDVATALVEVIRDDGPMPCHYAYELYRRASGLGRISRPMRKVFNRAISSAVKTGHLIQEQEYASNDSADLIVRVANTPRVRLRERGERILEQIPPSEIAALMDELTKKSKAVGRLSREVIFRMTLDEYGLIRLTKKAEEILSTAYEIYWKLPKDIA
jgi:very-short-patch-repair endonuclease